MALPGKSIEEILTMSKGELEEYFLTHARYFRENPPNSRYGIRVGSKSLTDCGTYELRLVMEAHVAKLKRRKVNKNVINRRRKLSNGD